MKFFSDSDESIGFGTYGHCGLYTETGIEGYGDGDLSYGSGDINNGGGGVGSLVWGEVELSWFDLLIFLCDGGKE